MNSKHICCDTYKDFIKPYLSINYAEALFKLGSASCNSRST